jgi:Na+-driven multidrug efflux pump
VLVIAALGQPIAGVVFVLDGVLIGAGDGRFLAWAGLVVLVVYTPAAFAAAYLTGGLVAVWVAFAGVFMGARFVVLTRRARGDAWLVTGAVRAPARR